MTPIEKSKEIAQKYFPDALNIWAKNVDAYKCEYACLEAMDWKDEQNKADVQKMLNYAYEWLDGTFKDLAGYYSGAELLDTFKELMEKYGQKLNE